MLDQGHPAGTRALRLWCRQTPVLGEGAHGRGGSSCGLGAGRAWGAKLARIAWRKHCNGGKSTCSSGSLRDLVYILTLPIAMWPWRSHLTSLHSVFLYKTKGRYWVSSSYCNCLSDGNSPATQFSPGSSVGTSTSVGRRGAPCHCPGNNFMITGLGSITPWTVPPGDPSVRVPALCHNSQAVSGLLNYRSPMSPATTPFGFYHLMPSFGKQLCACWLKQWIKQMNKQASGRPISMLLMNVDFFGDIFTSKARPQNKHAEI